MRPSADHGFRFDIWPRGGEAGEGQDQRETPSPSGSPCGGPKGDPASAADRSGARFWWRVELGPVLGLVGAAIAVPGSNVHSEVVQDPHCDSLGHPRRRRHGGAAAEKRHRPVSPLPVQHQQNPAPGPATRRGRLHDSGRREAVGTAAGHQDVQHVGRRRGAIGSRPACSGPHLTVRSLLFVRHRLIGWCCWRGDRR
jgi:hypothetical protein